MRQTIVSRESLFPTYIAAMRLGITPASVRVMARLGRIVAALVTSDGRSLYSAEEVDRVLAARATRDAARAMRDAARAMRDDKAGR